MRKINSFICHTCKIFNPKLILIEYKDKSHNQVLKIELLILKRSKNFKYYKKEIIFISHDKYKTSNKIEICGSCHYPISRYKEEKHEPIDKIRIR